MTAVAVDCTTTVGPITVHARFTADAGITALFGPSGAGKSVTLATIAGLLRPAAGTVALQGTTVADPAKRIHVPTQDRHLGMVFQEAALLPHRSPLDNVALAVSGGDTRAGRRERARRWLDRVHASHLATVSTSGLSGGEQQRIALARALAGEPRTLLLDEPFTALDQPTRESLRELVSNLVSETGITALVVTHDIADIATLADRVVVFEPGRTIATHELHRHRPDHHRELVELLGLGP
ncbi:MAG: ATP-binding cassette domain-containing protein [Acidimicrobiales bacterium]